MLELVYFLTCYHCGKRTIEDTVVPVGTAKDNDDRDIVWYICPHCGDRVDSFRYPTTRSK